ncbi:hypothetical protein SAMN05421805_102161 [Saccharopolyspora antimicrobica]|uniref:Uncharacterized protein n=1 Tax=Saccharopolyspora antimicrobica TaxID=455193 RepID=A0A1I4VEX8_9PSEU|nr:hypothetical protein [Saccharopolyspora antimicrobica]RKT86265.1 hypothetical protein ATL45_4627 [Saccharopolyspora antimicrobica]SFM99613.1 hypothetical protein SAMN05421805_102161 [Saccharopolyspora antimicrobica]
MSDDDVFDRRWVLAEDELLRMLWRSHAGENPDVLLVELHANHRGDRRNPGPFGARNSRPARQHHRRHRVVR